MNTHNKSKQLSVKTIYSLRSKGVFNKHLPAACLGKVMLESIKGMLFIVTQDCTIRQVEKYF